MSTYWKYKNKKAKDHVKTYHGTVLTLDTKSCREKLPASSPIELRWCVNPARTGSGGGGVHEMPGESRPCCVAFMPRHQPGRAVASAWAYSSLRGTDTSSAVLPLGC